MSTGGKNIAIDLNALRTRVLLFLFAIYLFVFLSGSLLSVSLTGLSVSVVVAYFLITIRKGMKGTSINVGQVFVYSFLIYGILTVFWSQAPAYGFRKLFFVMVFVGIMGLFRTYLVKNISLFLKYFSAVFFAFLLFFFLQNGFAVFDITSVYSRFNLTGDQNPIVVAYFLAFGTIALMTFMFLQPRHLVTYLTIIAGAFFSFSLTVLTGSKGPLIGMLGSFFIVLILDRGISFSLLWRMIAGTVVLGGIVSYVSQNFTIDPLILEFIEARFTGDNESSGSFSTRLALYDLTSKEYYASHPFAMIFGHGSGSFGYIYTGRDEMMYPHNLFLEILFEYGVIGLVLFLVMILRVILLNIFYRIDRPSQFLFFVFYFALIVSQISRDITGNSLIFVFYIFLEEAYSQKFHFKKSYQNE